MYSSEIIPAGSSSFLSNYGNGSEFTSFQSSSLNTGYVSNVTIHPYIAVSSRQSEVSESVGQPGDWESVIPIWGSGRAAVDHFQNGNYWRGIGYSALAISDVFLVKAIYTGIVKGGIKIAGSSSWNATRKYYLKKGFAKPNQPLHHWLIHQKGLIGKHIPNGLKNQMWNLKSFSNASIHMRAGHGKSYLGQKGYGILGQMWYGIPDWPKLFISSFGGRGIISLFEDYQEE